MADQLSVDPDGLVTFADRMDQARSQFDISSGYVGSMGSETGPAEVCDGLSDFDRRWTAARQIMDSYFAGIATVARNVATALTATDQNLAGSLPHFGGHPGVDY